MRLLTIPVALALSVLCTAYPQPLRQNSNLQGQQQITFDSFHPHQTPSHNNNDNIGYARFDEQQVLRVEVSSMEELKKFEATVEVYITTIHNPLYRFEYTRKRTLFF